MKTKSTLLKKLALGILIISSLNGVSQSNPTPFNLETGGTYTFTDWLSTSAPSTYPHNMIFHIMANANPTLTSVASADVVAGVYNDASAKTRMNGLGAGGFSFRNSSTVPDIAGYISNRLGEAVLAINTTNRTTINISFKAGEIGSATPVYSITCQYRIGTTGAYLSLPGASSLWQYLSNNPLSSVSFGPITLPAACDNQSVVQLRWSYTYVSGATTGLKPQLFVDDITVTSIPLITLTPLPNTCSSNPPFLLTDGQPAGGVYTGIGVVGGNFDPSVAGTGIQTITYTYTDINGFSNFASTTIDVEASYCVTTTSLKPVSCGATGLSIDSYIYCESVFGATAYEFTISNPALGYSSSLETGVPVWACIRLNKFSGLLYGTTYNVSVRAKVGGLYGAVGPVCQISLKPFPSTNLDISSCGATGLNHSSTISCNIIPGASEYEYTISNTSKGYSSTQNFLQWIRLTKFSGLLYGETYDVSVRAKVSGVWGPVGPVCQISLMSFPSTCLNTSSCGANGLNTYSYIYANIIAGATNYEFTISNSSLGYSLIKDNGMSLNYIRLNLFPGIQYGETYDVSVRAKVSGVWGPVGPVCQITMMPFPSTSLNTTSCGSVGLTNLSYLFCNTIYGATNYEYTITNSSLGYSKVKNSGSGVTYIKLNAFAGLLANTTYNVTVKAFVSGVWGPEGLVCSITTAPTYVGMMDQYISDNKQMEINNSLGLNSKLKIYPNPLSKNSILVAELENFQSITVVISDILGRNIYENNFSNVNSFEIPLSDLKITEGIYNLTILNGVNKQNQKFVITK